VENHPSRGRSEKSQMCVIIILWCAWSGKVWYSCVLHCVLHVLLLFFLTVPDVIIHDDSKNVCVKKAFVPFVHAIFIVCFHAYMHKTGTLKNCICAWNHAIKNCMYIWSSWWWRHDDRNT
jgi:hypothetical protein